MADSERRNFRRARTPRGDDSSKSISDDSISSSSQNILAIYPSQISGTPIPSSPSPIRAKRPQTSQLLAIEGRPLLLKKFKYEKEVTLHILLPNQTSFKFTADAARIHSIDVLLNLVKKSFFDHQQDGELESTLTIPIARKVNWDSPDVYLENDVGHRLTNESVFIAMSSVKMGGIIILLVQDGAPNSTYSDLNMWNVTPKPEMLKRPQGYSLETALADQVDNALQAVWDNDKGCRRLVSVDLSPDKITIFDTGRGMDASEGNCIANWGTMGSSTHRTVHYKAVGGKPPFLTPYLGMYGAGAVASALHLGGRATIWSKSSKSKRVVCLVLEEKELQERHKEDPALDQQVWRTGGGFREMTEEEHEMSPHGSFTRVEITKLEPHYCLVDNGRQYWEVDSLRRSIKNIYFPYIQSDDSSSSRTVCPVEFVVNGMDLVEILQCETAIFNKNTCNGPEPFEFNICAKQELDGLGTPTMAGKMVQVANARVICQYYPNKKGKEALETVLEELKVLSPLSSMTFENMPRVDVRWLGRLLPDVKWPIFPFMVIPPKMGQRSELRLWSKRIRASVDCDAGFHPTQSKTELERDQPFVVALKNTGSESFAGTSALGVDVSIERKGKKMSTTQLADTYRKWLMDMHARYDEEFLFIDEATYIFNQENPLKENALKELGVGNKLVLVFHKHIKDSQQEWKIDEQNPIWMKLPKGIGLKVPKYVTLEYFFYDGADNDHGNQVKFLCRGMEVDAADGCKITYKDGNPVFELGSSECFPAALLSTSKRLDVTEWKKKYEEILNKSAGYVEVLNEQDAEKFDMCEVFPDANSKFEAGFTLPRNFLVVIRPRKGSGLTFKQGMIVGEPMGIALTVTHCNCSGIVCQERRVSVSSGEGSLSHISDDHTQVVCHLSAQSSIRNGIKGLYMFSTESSFSLVTEGIYTFHFTVENEKYRGVDPAVSMIQICPSRITVKWTICTHASPCMLTNHENTSDNIQAPVIRLNEQVKEDLFLQKYDEYGNRQFFETPMELELMAITPEGESLDMEQTNVQSSIVTGPEGRRRLRLKSVIFRNGVLERVRPTYEALLRVCITEEQHAEIRCKVLPGALATVEVESSKPLITTEAMCFEDALQPGEIIKNLTLQGLDSCGNEIEKGQQLQVLLTGLEFQDNCGNHRVADENGRLQLGGLLKVTCHYNSTGSMAITSGTGLTFCTVSFKTPTRHLVASQVPKQSYVGRQLDGVSVRIVDESGVVDTLVDGHKHSITTDWLEGVACPFTQGECKLPGFKLPEKPGCWEGKVFLSGNTTLSITLMVELELATACSLGSGKRTGTSLTAESGVPFVLPFFAYDDHHKPALLTELMKKTIIVKAAAKDCGDESDPIFRRLVVDCKDVTMSRTADISNYEAHIVLSGSVGTYTITLANTSGNLNGEVESMCKLQHGRIAQLVLARSDQTRLEEFEETASGPLPIIKTARCSPLPKLTVTLLDSEDNICISSVQRKLRMHFVDCTQWQVLETVVIKGIGRFESPSLLVPVGRYLASIELDTPPADPYSLEEPIGLLTTKFSLRVNCGNYPSGLKLLSSSAISVVLTDKPIQYLTPMSVLVESADGLTLQCRPTVGVKLHGHLDSSLRTDPDPNEYFGTFVESCEMEMESHLKQEHDCSSSPLKYEFTEVCAPSQASTYILEFFIRGFDVPSISQHLIVLHGPPNRIEITGNQSWQEVDVLQVSLVDAHGNICENVIGLELGLELDLNKDFSVTLGLSPCAISSKLTSLVERGYGNFGVFQVTQGVPGIYTLKIYAQDDEGEMEPQSLIPVEAQIFIFQGNPGESVHQLIIEIQACQPMDDCSIQIEKYELEIERKRRTQQTLENKTKRLEGASRSCECQKLRVKALQEAANDDEILRVEREQSCRTEQAIVYDMRRLAGNGHGAALAFWEARAGTNFLSPQIPDPVNKEFLGFVATLARVENDSLSRMLAEFLGQKVLLLIVARTQRAIDALVEYDANGEIDKTKGLYGFAHTRGYKISGRFSGLALTDTRPYKEGHGSAVNVQHPQEILNIDPPSLPGGQVPKGFLGYAVNLLYLTVDQLRIKVSTQIQGTFGLRESLFYHLLGNLQVYDTRHNMITAKEKVNNWKDAAISLDGGLIHKKQLQQLGKSREIIPGAFSIVPLEERERESLMPPACHAFGRLRQLSDIDMEINRIQETLSYFMRDLDETIMQIKKLKRNLSLAKTQQQENLEANKVIHNQIAQLKRAASEIASRNPGSTARDSVDLQSVDSGRMRSFLIL